MKKSAFLPGRVFLFLTSVLSAGDLADIQLEMTKVVDLPFVATDLKAPPDGSNRLFALSTSGEIRIIDLEAGSVSATPFMQVPDVLLGAGERAAYSLAFHPDYTSNGFFYVHHAISGNPIAGATTGNRIVRFQATDTTTADPGSALVLLETDKYSNFHFGGTLEFGPDGYLYVAIGDDERFGGSPQELFNLMGKILRLDVDMPSGGRNYGIPADNPVAAGTGFQEILIRGLRNPWRFSFDRDTGALWIADVGEDGWEEISRIESYTSPSSPPDCGWPYYEGNEVFDAFATVPVDPVPPVHVYGHTGTPPNRSVTGGYVYRGSRFPRMQGVYFFGDYITASISGLEHDGTWTARELADHPNFETITTFGEDAVGELYVALSLGVYHLGDTLETTSETLVVVDAGINVSGFFQVTVTGTQEASLQLQRRDDLGSGSWENIGGPVVVGSTDVTLTDITGTVPSLLHPRRFYRVMQTLP